MSLRRSAVSPRRSAVSPRRSAVIVGAVLTLTAGAGVVTAGSAAAAVPKCTAATTALSMSAIHPGANLHTGVLLHVTNTGSAACVVYGYPLVSLLKASGVAVQTAERTPTGYLGGAAPARTVLGSGAQATALLEWVAAPNPDSQPYPPTASIRLRLPGDTQNITVSPGAPDDPNLQVHGFVAGSTGGAPGA